MRQIGVAVGNAEIGTCQALAILRARDGIPDWQQIEGLLKEWKPGRLIVGLPLNMDDSESELSTRARKFGRRLEGRFAIPISFQDERLSSFEAKQQLREQGHRGNYKDSPADSVAAELILRSWLEGSESRGQGA